MREQQSREVSQGKLESRARQLRVDVAALKLPPILDLACSDAKQKDWGNIVTVHEGLPCARVWSFDRLALNPDMRLAPRDGAQPTACAISFCGNFALLGTSSGGVEKFNLQSGLHRGSSNTANAGSSETGDGDSGNSITCIACDGCNRTVITGSANGAVTYWDLKTLARKDTVYAFCFWHFVLTWPAFCPPPAPVFCLVLDRVEFAIGFALLASGLRTSAFTTTIILLQSPALILSLTCTTLLSGA